MEIEVSNFMKILDHSIRQDLVCCFDAKEAKVKMEFDAKNLRLFIYTSATVKKIKVDSNISIDYYYIVTILKNDDVVPYINALTALIVCETVGYKDKYQKLYRKCKLYDKKY